jgi:hypothetical protein
MSEVFSALAVSVDGYITGRDPGPGRGLGDGGTLFDSYFDGDVPRRVFDSFTLCEPSARFFDAVAGRVGASIARRPAAPARGRPGTRRDPPPLRGGPMILVAGGLGMIGAGDGSYCRYAPDAGRDRPPDDRGDPAPPRLQRLQPPAGHQPRVRGRPTGDHPRPVARPHARTAGRPRRRTPTSTPPVSPTTPASRRPSTSPRRSPTTSPGAPTTRGRTDPTNAGTR